MKESIKGYKRYLFFAVLVVALAIIAVKSIDSNEVKQASVTEKISKGNKSL